MRKASVCEETSAGTIMVMTPWSLRTWPRLCTLQLTSRLTPTFPEFHWPGFPSPHHLSPTARDLMMALAGSLQQRLAVGEAGEEEEAGVVVWVVASVPCWLSGTS